MTGDPLKARCPRCGRTLPLDAFHKQRSRSTGRAAHCKECRSDAARQARNPGACAPVVKLTPRPEPLPPVEVAKVLGLKLAPPPAPTPHSDAVEEFLQALDPPAGKADAILVVTLRDLAKYADAVTDMADSVRLSNAMVRLQRELAGTRLAKSSTGGVVAPPTSKLDAFRAAL